MIKQRHVAALFAEFIGTLILAVVVFAVGLYNFLFFTTAAAGVTLAILVTSLGRVSGGHFNPIITIGLFVVRQISFAKALAYVSVQFLAGGAAYLLIDKYLTASPVYDGVENLTNSATVNWNIATAEFLGAFVFATIVAAVVLNKVSNPPAAGAIGGGLFLGLTFASLPILLRLTTEGGDPIAFAGIINPALAISAGAFSWVDTFFAPIAGSVLAMIVVAVMMVPIKDMVGTKKDTTKPAVVAKPEVKESSASKPAVKKAPAKKPAAKKPAVKKAPAKKKTTKK